MKKITLSISLICISLLVLAWGTWGHQHINYAAIWGLPEPLRFFFYNHKDFITEESVVPDLRKYTLNDKAEFNRHFIDIEDFGVPIDSIARTTKEAQTKYDAKSLQKWGILPWFIQDMEEKLVTAMKNGKKTEILFVAADLGHYIADANMPLHTSSNHDGQLTNQKGIHALWESQLPDYFGKNYDFKVKPAVYINDITAETWKIIASTHKLVDSVLYFEKTVRQAFTGKEMYKKDANGVILKNKYGQNIYSNDYALAFHTAMKGMVERQMNKSVQDVSNFWYTAWVNAGKPDLVKLDPKALTDRNKQAYKEDLKRIESGKTFGFKADPEFDVIDSE